MNLRINSFLSLLFFMFFILTGCKTVENPPRTVEKVDIEKYAGTWYEIASFPAPFQEGCTCTTAEYISTDKGYLKVLNKCRKGSESDDIDKATGKAFVVEGSGNAKLKVQFFWPFRADYWILALANDYSYAAVGSPDREYLWILSRQPQIDESSRTRMEAQLKEKGFDISRLENTPQNCWQSGME